VHIGAAYADRVQADAHHAGPDFQWQLDVPDSKPMLAFQHQSWLQSHDLSLPAVTE
jgi:hypothetical protein